MWDSVHRKIVCSRDVIFHETSFPALQGSDKPDKEYVPLSLFQNYSTSTSTLPQISHPVGDPMSSTTVEYNSQIENDEEESIYHDWSLPFEIEHHEIGVSDNISQPTWACRKTIEEGIFNTIVSGST